MYNTLDEDNYYDVCGDRSTERGHEDYGMCMAGASATASKVRIISRHVASFSGGILDPNIPNISWVLNKMLFSSLR
jgi:hypothetical protein